MLSACGRSSVDAKPPAQGPKFLRSYTYLGQVVKKEAPGLVGTLHRVEQGLARGRAGEERERPSPPFCGWRDAIRLRARSPLLTNSIPLMVDDGAVSETPCFVAVDPRVLLRNDGAPDGGRQSAGGEGRTGIGLSLFASSGAGEGTDSGATHVLFHSLLLLATLYLSHFGCPLGQVLLCF